MSNSIDTRDRSDKSSFTVCDMANRTDVDSSLSRNNGGCEWRNSFQVDLFECLLGEFALRCNFGFLFFNNLFYQFFLTDGC